MLLLIVSIALVLVTGCAEQAIDAPAAQSSVQEGTALSSTAIPDEPSLVFPVLPLKNRQVLQRDPARHGVELTLTPVCSGAIDLSVVDMEQVLVVSWQPLQCGQSNNLFIPEGGWYRFQLRANGEIITDKNIWGVGMVILTIGQSNMSGRGQAPAVTADDRASNFREGSWEHLVDPYDLPDTVAVDSDWLPGASMTPGLVNDLIAHYNFPVAVIPAALGSTPLVPNLDMEVSWSYRDLTNPFNVTTLYGNAVTKAIAAGGVELVVYNQGEADIAHGVLHDAYLEALRGLVDALQTDLGPVGFFYVQTGPQGDCKTLAAVQEVASAQLDLNGYHDSSHLAATVGDLQDDKLDCYHFDTPALTTIGQRVASSIIQNVE